MRVIGVDSTINRSYCRYNNEKHVDTFVIKNESRDYSDKVNFTANPTKLEKDLQRCIEEGRKKGKIKPLSSEDGFVGVNQLRELLREKLESYKKGLDVYGCVDSEYIRALKHVKKYICGDTVDEFVARPDLYTEIGPFYNKRIHAHPDENSYLEYVKSNYGSEAIYCGQVPAICGFETLNYLMDKQVLADAVMKHTWQAMTILSRTFSDITDKFLFWPSLYKNSFIKIVDYLASDEGSKILSNETFCTGIHKVLDCPVSLPREDYSSVRIAEIKRATEDSKFLKRLVTPDWQKENSSIRQPYREEIAQIKEYLANNGYSPSTFERARVGEYSNLDGGRSTAVLDDGREGYKYLFTINEWKY